MDKTPICFHCDRPATHAVRDMWEVAPNPRSGGIVRWVPDNVVWMYCDEHVRNSRDLGYIDHENEIPSELTFMTSGDKE